VRVASDAVAVAIATGFAFVCRAGLRDYDSLAPGHLASLILPALPFVIPVALLALWSGGMYRSGDAGKTDRFFGVASALAWAAALLAFLSVSWDKGPEAPMIVMAAGYPAAMALVLAGRRLSDARALAAVSR
jgi:peptidoglycan/LPS O-acetylase OafA/YrhL